MLKLMSFVCRQAWGIRIVAAVLALQIVMLPLSASASASSASEVVPVGLPDSMVRMLESQRISVQNVSLWVSDAQGNPRIAHNVDVPRNPASLIKLHTAWTALETLGPGYRWETGVYTFAPIVGDVLQGDLYIRGGGDPWLVSEEVWKLTGALRRQGIREIQGDLVFDLSLFDLEPEDPGAFDGQRFRAYNQPPHALLMNFNALRFEFRPDADGRSVRVTTDPPNSVVQVDNQLRLQPRSCSGFQRGVNFQVVDEERVRLDGSFPSTCREYGLLRTAVSPEAFAYGLFREMWQQWGGSLNGQWRLGALPPEVLASLRQDRRSDSETSDAQEAYEPLVLHRSPMLAELLGGVNKRSNNVMTRQMKLAIGLEKYGPPATVEKGNQTLREFFAERLPGHGEIMLDNAAGLSRTNRITARQLAGVLSSAQSSLYAPEFLSSLALSGVDGTLRERFVEHPAAGRMRLKTGYLRDVSGVAGYVNAASGSAYTVVLMINYPGIDHSRGVDIQDAILEAIYEERF